MKRIEIIGYIGADAQARIAPNGSKFYSFSVATNEKYRDSNGNTIEETTWFNVSTNSEKLAEYLKKGTYVFVSGNPKINIYYSEMSGESKATIQIGGAEIRLLSSNNRSDRSSTTPDRPNRAQGNTATNTRRVTPEPEPQPLDDDMPF